MLDIRIIRQEPDRVKDSLSRRCHDLDLDDVLTCDRLFRETQTALDALRHRRNDSSERIARLKKEQRHEEAAALIVAMKDDTARLKALEAEMPLIEQRRQALLLRIPNLLDVSVPDGADEASNVEVRRWGMPADFSFPVKAHHELGETLGLLDFERAAKLVGARFVVMRDLGARLERAVLNFMLDVHTTRHGYTEIQPPYVANAETLTANGNLPKFADQLFKLEDTDYYLIPTAEIPLTNLYRNEILPEASLPLYFTAGTPCFRSEAGAAGRDTRGIIRMHQFDKVEMVKIVHPENSMDELDKMVANAETILQELGLPYRVIQLCGGDTGANAAKTYDLEVWFPSQGKYREISSCSNCTDFQARRGNMRFRDSEGKLQWPHTLNGSGLAVGRTVAAILENCQTASGEVRIPDALRPYLGGVEWIRSGQSLEKEVVR